MTTPVTPNNYPLGTSRGKVGDRYYLMTPDTMVENSLPFLPPYSVVVLTAPQGTPARFGEYLITLEKGQGSRAPLGAGFENFLFVLAGEISVATGEDEITLPEGGYIFMPEGQNFSIDAKNDSRFLWVKKRYLEVAGVAAPEMVTGNVADVKGIEDDWIDGSYGQLLPDDERYDMAMNIMRFESGSRFRMIEIHHQEHGLYMLEGGGVYHLDGDHFEVRKDDFIYMAPYCTQAFTVAGAGKSAYLLYKDVNRDGF